MFWLWLAKRALTCGGLDSSRALEDSLVCDTNMLAGDPVGAVVSAGASLHQTRLSSPDHRCVISLGFEEFGNQHIT